MKIYFPRKHISKGPLEVLRDLYYHTVQYGLSVKQYTGGDQDYWERLPDRLREAGSNSRKLNKIIRELEKLAGGAPERLKRRRAQIGRFDEPKKAILEIEKLLAKAEKKPQHLTSIIEGLEELAEILDEDFEGRSEWKQASSSVRRKISKAKKDPARVAGVVKRLQALTDTLHDEIDRRRVEISGKWAEKEIVLNAQLVSVLGALPGELLAIMLGKLTSAGNTPPVYSVVDYLFVKKSRRGGNFVQPDLLLLGESKLLMVEMKTRGGSGSSRSYPPRQLLNYMRLIAECQRSETKGLPTQFSHLILVPSTDPKWLEKHNVWVRETLGEKGGRIQVNPNACLRFGKRFSRENQEDMKSLLTEIPIYYHSWKQLSEAFESAVDEFKDGRNKKHWNRIGNELKYLAQRAGKYA